ncbi:succinate dehydrogenase, hydrophobic membrane anchor protein [Rickettsia endosymbiont of Halotydeus destructor]|uniref:succinate dehydrogenase, hydrophobic membrane anchor protein n=1 Tax=Rickettsia endosymbiont of Halotydeus destructor TaxID=2996754 RepID=UPI003BB1DC1B
MSNDLKTDIAKAKGLGSAKTGSHHWLMQRITGMILALCSLWLMYFILINKNNDLNIIIEELKKSFNVTPLLIIVIASFYHAMLGMRVVIEDYINCIKLRISLIVLLQLFSILTIVAFIVALFYKNS